MALTFEQRFMEMRNKVEKLAKTHPINENKNIYNILYNKPLKFKIKFDAKNYILVEGWSATFQVGVEFIQPGKHEYAVFPTIQEAENLLLSFEVIPPKVQDVSDGVEGGVQSDDGSMQRKR